MRRLRDRIAAFESTDFDLIRSDISRFAAMSSLFAVNILPTYNTRARGASQRAGGGFVDLLIELGRGREPACHRGATRVTEIELGEVLSVILHLTAVSYAVFAEMLADA